MNKKTCKQVRKKADKQETSGQQLASINQVTKEVSKYMNKQVNKWEEENYLSNLNFILKSHRILFSDVCPQCAP